MIRYNFRWIQIIKECEAIDWLNAWENHNWNDWWASNYSSENILARILDGSTLLNQHLAATATIVSHKSLSAGVLLASFFLHGCCVRLPACYVHAGCHLHKRCVTATKWERWHRSGRKRPGPARRGSFSIERVATPHAGLSAPEMCPSQRICIGVFSYFP